jgi:hypothetical protein
MGNPGSYAVADIRMSPRAGEPGIEDFILHGALEVNRRAALRLDTMQRVLLHKCILLFVIPDRQGA